jgi:DME family drug/metabolite transporter
MPVAPDRDGQRRPAWFALSQVALAGLIWGTIGVGVMLVRRHAPLSVLTIGAYRILIAAVLLGVTLIVTRRLPTARRLLAEYPVRTVTVGVITGAFQNFYFAAIVTANVSIATVISLGFAPLLVTAATAARSRSWPDRRHVASVAVALGGLVLVTFASGGGGQGPHPVLGVLAALASGTCYGTATMLAEPLTRQYDAISVTAVTTPAGAAVLVPLAVIVAVIGDHPIGTGNPEAISLLVYLGAITTALAYALLYAGLRTTPSGVAVIATLIEPVAAAVLAVLILSEHLKPLGLVGGVLILAAIALLGASADEPEPVGQ